MAARRWDATRRSPGQETQQAPGGWPGARTEAVCVGGGGKGGSRRRWSKDRPYVLPSQAPTYSGSVPLCAKVDHLTTGTVAGFGPGPFALLETNNLADWLLRNHPDAACTCVLSKLDNRATAIASRSDN